MKKNPVAPNSTSIETGKKIYITSCSPCHGQEGKGNGIVALNLKPQPADHTRKIFQKQKDGEIFYKISTGRNAMPAFQHTISENELWCVVNFVRTLAEKSLPVSVPQKTVKQKKQ